MSRSKLPAPPIFLSFLQTIEVNRRLVQQGLYPNYPKSPHPPPFVKVRLSESNRFDHASLYYSILRQI